ncbi:glycosyltransferase [Kitasatospora phosalacinea]|uniref:glycosyltransferase n=1 Tax=Kitasatospora phosalacinea TaxID=2065 RepID=UPI0035E2ADD9
MTTTVPTPRRPAATVTPTSLHGLLRTLRRLTHQHRDPLLRYALPATLTTLLPLLWFRPGRDFATGDVGPFRREGLGAELGSVWGHQITGTGGPSYEIVRLPDLLLVRLCGLFGLGPGVAQAVLYALVLAGAATGVARLASVWLRHPLAAACAGLLAVVNVYTLVSLLNPLPVLATALVAWFGGHLLHAAAGRRVRVRAVVLSSLPLCYLGMNPPLLAVVAGATAVLALVAAPLTGGRWRPVAGLVGRALPLLVLVQLWWLVPQAVTLTGGGSGTDFSAQTNVQAWAWTQVRNTLPNILALNAHWGWSHAEYYPFASAVDRAPWGAVRWVPALLALAGAVLPPGPRRTRWAMRVLAVATGVLVLLCKGLHPPLAGVNAWLYAHVPGMWLFREPMSKFGVLLVLVVAVLAGAAVQRALDAGRKALRASAAVAVVAALAYPWPLWTGAVVTWVRPPLPSASVAVPAQWQRVADAANGSAVPGKVLELPLQGYYQVLTDWGFHGVDDLPRNLLTRPLLQRLPGGYFDNASGPARLLALAEDGLAAGDADAAAGALRALGVGQVLVRRDLRSTAGDATTADPTVLAAALDRLPGARRTLATPVADLYELPSPAGAATGLVLDPAADPRTTAGAAARGAATTVDPAVPVDAARLAFTAAGGAEVRLRADGGPYAARVDRGAGTAYLPSRTAEGVRLADAGRAAVDGVPAPAAPELHLGLPADAAPAALLVGPEVLPWQPDRPVTVRPGDRVAVALADGPELAAAPDAQADGGCGGATDRAGDGSWVLRAEQGTACVRLPLADPPADGLVEVSVEYRGSAPRICLWQDGPNGCAVERRLPAADDWRTFRTALRLAPGTTGAVLYGYADADGTRPGDAAYRAPAATALGVAAEATAAAGDAPLPLGPGPHRVDADPGLPAAGPPAFSALQDCGRTDGRGFAEAGLSATPLGSDGVRLTARAHTACVSVPVDAFEPGTGRRPGSYRLAVDYRTVSGSPARLCLWQGGPDRCAELPRTVDGPQWHTLDTVVTPPADVRDLALYLYADGDDAGTTTVEYTGVRLTPVLPLAVRIDPEAFATPAVAAVPDGAGRYRARLSGVDGPAVVTLPDSADPRWELTGLPAGWSARPLTLDGYRAAWLVDGHGDAELHVAFGPDRWWRAAVGLSAATVLACATVLLPRRRTSPDHRPLEPVRPPMSAAPSVPSVPPAPAAPRIAVVVPTRDSVPQVGRLLDSLVQQREGLEVLVNEDERTSRPLAPALPAFHARGLDVRLARDNPSRAAGRRRGVRLTSAAVVLHLDSDMTAGPGLLAECRRLIEDEGYDALVIPEVSVGEGFWSRCKVLEKRCWDGDLSVESLRCLRRELYDRVGGHDEELVWSEDKDLDLRVRATGARIATTRSVLVHDEGRTTLRAAMRKKAHYAATAGRYAARHPRHFAAQAGPWRLPVLAARAWRLSRDPLLTVGLLLLKTCEFAAAGAALLTAPLAGAHRGGGRG